MSQQGQCPHKYSFTSLSHTHTLREPIPTLNGTVMFVPRDPRDLDTPLFLVGQLYVGGGVGSLWWRCITAVSVLNATYRLLHWRHNTVTRPPHRFMPWKDEAESKPMFNYSRRRIISVNSEPVIFSSFFFWKFILTALFVLWQTCRRCIMHVKWTMINFAVFHNHPAWNGGCGSLRRFRAHVLDLNW